MDLATTLLISERGAGECLWHLHKSVYEHREAGLGTTELCSLEQYSRRFPLQCAPSPYTHPLPWPRELTDFKNVINIFCFLFLTLYYATIEKPATVHTFKHCILGDVPNMCPALSFDNKLTSHSMPLMCLKF